MHGEYNVEFCNFRCFLDETSFYNKGTILRGIYSNTVLEKMGVIRYDIQLDELSSEHLNIKDTLGCI
jgi:hypothetical protein